MMVLKIFFSPDEIQQFFAANGFKVELRDFGHYRPAYHNRDEWVETPENAVIINGRHVKASELFEKVAEQRLKRMIAPENLETKRIIEKTFKALAK
jgi:hypothetical protein